MEKSSKSQKEKMNIQGYNVEFSPADSQNASDIFELLKNIKDAKTNEELIGYFQFTRFYGLLDPSSKELLTEIENKQLRTFNNLLYGLTIGAAYSYYFYKRSYYNTVLIGLCLGIPPLLWFNYRAHDEINFLLLDMKDKYIYKVDKFFKDNKNPNVLNHNFLAEELVDPNLKSYQELLKRKATKNF